MGLSRSRPRSIDLKTTISRIDAIMYAYRVDIEEGEKERERERGKETSFVTKRSNYYLRNGRLKRAL